MTYIEYLNQFWKVHEEHRFPASTIAFYVYLLNECNRRNWKMPFSCSSVRICDEISVSRQTLSTARQQLADAGFISFIDGKSRYISSAYTILDLTDDLTDDLTVIYSKDKDYRKTEREKEIPTVADVESYMAVCVIPTGYELKPGLAKRFIDYYEAKGWMVGNSPMIDWQAAARKWTNDSQNLLEKYDGTDKRNKECGNPDNRAETGSFIEELKRHTIRISNGE